MTSSTSITVPDSRGVLARAVKWAAIGILAVVGLRFFWLHALRYTNVTEHTYRRYWPYRGWLMVHIAGGSLALLLGPGSFSAESGGGTSSCTAGLEGCIWPVW